MRLNPKLVCDLAKIRHNASNMKSLLAPLGIEVICVTKAVCAEPDVARAVVAGGITKLADSRLANIARMRQAGVLAHMTLLRSPMVTEVMDAAALVDRVLVSDTTVLAALDSAARRLGRTIEVVLMVDLGDLREGFWPYREEWHSGVPEEETLMEAVPAFAGWKNLKLVGLGVNLACYGAIIPTPEKMNLLARLSQQASGVCGYPLPVVSGGNSANLRMVIQGAMPEGITELRIGEGILLGTEAVDKTPVPGAYQDAFTFVGEVIEVRRKPSVPIGESGIDAFGKKPMFVDKGIRERAIIAAGRQDSDWEDMVPREPGIQVIGSSSDHLVLDVTDRPVPTRVGEELHFGVGYSCLLRAATSEYVRKVYI